MAHAHCPHCGKAQVVEEMRLQNPETGRSVEAWSLGCIYQTALVTTIVAIAAVGFAVLQPGHAFAEAAALVALVTMVFVAAGIFVTWRHLTWAPVRHYGCTACGHTWEEPRLPAPGTVTEKT